MDNKVAKTPVSKEDEVETVLNENGKRPPENNNKDGVKRIKTKSLYRQPTVSELNRLYETENLFNSNLFRLQVDEILQEVKVKDKTITKFHVWYENLKKYLLTIPENNNEYDLSEDKIFKELKVKLPVGGVLKRTKCTFKFHKFTNIEIVGSYSLGCAINSKLCVDIQITVPANTYTKNDSINYKYHKKRATYLAFIASHLKKSDSIEELQYSWQNDCKSKPFISLKPKGKLGNHLNVRIILSCDADTFKLHRYSPSRNNLRESWFFCKETSEQNETGPPTPYYNSSVLQDLTMSKNHEFLQKMLGNSENLKQAIVLLKIWMRQRNISVSGFIVSMFVAHLVQIKRINNFMSSYQIVRNVWISLKSSEWDTKGISLNKGNESNQGFEDFLRHFPVVFLDTTGFHNICWQISINTYQALRRESTLAIEMLDNPNINSFIPLFMTSYKPLLQFDHILRFIDISKIKESVYNRVKNEDKVNYGVDDLALIANKIYLILSKGLGRRVDAVIQHVNADYSWPIKRSFDKAIGTYKEDLSFGLILNPENALDTVDKGPSANLPEAETFRAYWGDKSELRRFQDGSITETCVWEAQSLLERRMISKQIIEYLLKLKFDISSDIFYIANQLDSVLMCKQYISPNGALSIAEEDTVAVLQAFDELRRDLRSLSELPLDIHSVYGISPVFSYCDPFPPKARGLEDQVPWKRGISCLIKDGLSQSGNFKCPPYIPVSTAILELGHSGKWPGDLEAFRCLKAAFHIQIAESLTKQFSVSSQVHPAYIDVLKAGYVFRVQIAHTKEITLLQRELEAGVLKHRGNDESVELRCRSMLLPRLRGALHGLHQKYPAYGPATILTKRWLSSHLLDDYHFPHTAVELLVAFVFLRPEPLTAPTQPLAAFMRALNLISSKNWCNEPLIVNFNDELSKEEIMELEKRHADKQSAVPAMFIITPYDGDAASVWSEAAPTAQALRRARALATSALSFMEQSFLRESRDNVLGAFIPSLAGYDVIIHLHGYLVPHFREKVDKKPILMPLPPVDSEQTIIPVVEFNPVRKYLEELRNGFGEYALFFHDTYGGDVIAVLWKPDIKEKREFQVINANALKPVQHNDELDYEINLEAIVEDFRIIGDGLVKDITVN